MTGLVNSRPAAMAFRKLLDKQNRIGGVHVHRAIQVNAPSVLIADAEGPVRAKFTLDGQIALLVRSRI